MMYILKRIFISLFIAANVANISVQVPVQVHMPVVVLHGLESSMEKIAPFCDWLTDTFNSVVFNIEIGNGERTSMYTPMNVQLDELCETLYKIEELQYGFNFIGISQGGLLARGYVEQCNKYKVENLITLVSPHGGEFIKNIQTNFYTDFYQNHWSIAGYWRDPTNLNAYLDKCRYLPNINNEIFNNNSQKQIANIHKLANFVMVWSPQDNVLNPPESGKFSFYNIQLNVISLEDTELYKDDLLGLKFLKEKHRLHTYQTNCSHVDHRNPVCYSQLYEILKLFID